MLPQLEELEEKYRDWLVVIGVHSAKFTTEKEQEHLKRAVRRLGLHHPVLNDQAFEAWQAYAVRAWPTLVVIDAEGRVLGQHAGEFRAAELSPLLEKMARDARDRGVLVEGPSPFHLSVSPDVQILSFPGGVAYDDGTDRVFIADTGHHRIVVAHLSDGRIVQTIGSGSPGFKDGSFETAQFRRPEGVAFDGQDLWIADTENHAIRRVRLASRTVETAAGTGRQAQMHSAGGAADRQDLSSPWDLCMLEGTIYIAMAGLHQIWKLYPDENRIVPFAGSGREGIRDGEAHQSMLAQPSGLTTDGVMIYFTDSETSAVRALIPSPNPRVETLVGTGLFDFGDQDGSAEAVLLQHPIGIAWFQSRLLLSDSYNNKVKSIDPTTRACRTVAGSGRGGDSDGPADGAEFFEPCGLTAAGDRVLIADTDNHRVRIFNPSAGRVTTLDLHGL